MPSNQSYPPKYTELKQEASENLRQILPLVNKYKTPITPVNYAVWYEYVSGKNSALYHDLNNRLSANAPLTPEVTQYLFEKYVLFDMPNRLQKTNTGLKMVVENTLNNLSEVENTTNQCHAKFNDSQIALEECNDVEALQSLVKDLVKNTKTISENSQLIQQNLNASLFEIKRLKAELEAVKQDVEIDSLTGLLNRQALEKELELRCKQSKHQLHFALFDIDHFKRVNTKFGALVGDKVLQFLASVIKKHTANIHSSARFSGQVMAVVFIGITEEAGLRLAESIRLTLAKRNLKQRNSEEGIGQVTTSIGFTSLQNGDSPSALIDRAEKAVYKAKNNGRNRIEQA